MNQLNENSETVIANLDQILIEEVGQCGRFQLRVIVLCGVVALFSGFYNHLFIFTFSQVHTRCVVPECETNSSQTDFSPSWILNAIPAAGDALDNCHRFATISGATFNTCSTDQFNRNSTQECEIYAYEHTNSAIFEYNLACDNWRPNLVGFITSFGHMLGLPIGGFVADRWGRRIALALGAFNMAWMGCMLYFADTYLCYIIIAFMTTFIGASCYDNAYILAVEYVGPKYRVSVGATLSSFTALGRVIMGIVTWSEPYWRHLIFIVYGPSIITFLYFWIAPESIRWLMSKNCYKEAIVILKKAAKINGNTLSKDTLKSFQNAKVLEEKETETDQQWLVCLVFKHKPILLRCLVTPIWWITAVLVFCGLTITSVSISGNRFVNYSLVSAVAIPAYWVTVLLLKKIGRKPLLMASFWICGLCQLAYIITSKSNDWLSLTIYLASKMMSSVAMTTISVYTAELYPTRYRGSLYAFSSTIGSLGSAMAPLLLSLAANTWNHLPFAVFGGMAFLSGFLVLLAPETFGSTLPDTMEEAAWLGKVQHQDPARASKVLQPLI